MNFDEALAFVVSKRAIVSPNLGFSIQAQNFYTRLYQKEVMNHLKIYAIGYLNPISDIVVCRFMMSLSFCDSTADNTNIFDKRGIFLVNDNERIFILYGSMIAKEQRKVFENYAEFYIRLLQDYEGAPRDVTRIEGSEIENQSVDETNEDCINFKSLFPNNSDKLTGISEKWDNWYTFNGITTFKNKKVENDLSTQNAEQILKKEFYVYPSKQPTSIFDLDDFDSLADDVVLCLCQQSQSYRVFVWKNEDNNLYEVEEIDVYVSEMIEQFFGDDSKGKVQIFQEYAFKESDDFLKLI